MNKKILFFLFLPFLTFSQNKVDEFKLTPHGIDGYVVKDLPNFKSSELFEKVTKWAEYNIGNASYSKQSEIVDEYLKYKVVVPKGLSTKNGTSILYWDLYMDVGFRFKDNKIRIDISVEKMPGADMDLQDMQYRGGMITWSFYNNNGKPKKNTEQPRQQMNKLTNGLVDEIVKFITEETSEDDW